MRDVALPALLVYAAARACCHAAFALATSLPGAPTFLDVLGDHDGYWYRRVVEDGYPRTLPTGPDGIEPNTAGFFPLFPLLIRFVQLAGLSVTVSGLLVVTVAGAVSAVLVAAVVRAYAGPREAIGVVTVLSFLPASYVLCLVYSEALFLALAAGCMLALLNERWLVAGVAAAGATATRSAGVVLVAACLVAAVQRRQQGATGRAVLAPVGAAALAPVGILAFFGFLALHTGRADAYLASQREGWGTGIDGGVETTTSVVTALLHPLDKPTFLAVAVFILIVLAGVVLFVRDGAPPVVTVYTLGIVLLALTTEGTYSAIPRLVLPAFPLLLPLVRRAGPYLPVVVGASAVLLGASAVVVAVSDVITP